MVQVRRETWPLPLPQASSSPGAFSNRILWELPAPIRLARAIMQACSALRPSRATSRASGPANAVHTARPDPARRPAECKRLRRSSTCPRPQPQPPRRSRHSSGSRCTPRAARPFLHVHLSPSLPVPSYFFLSLALLRQISLSPSLPSHSLTPPLGLLTPPSLVCSSSVLMHLHHHIVFTSPLLCARQPRLASRRAPLPACASVSVPPCSLLLLPFFGFASPNQLVPIPSFPLAYPFLGFANPALPRLLILSADASAPPHRIHLSPPLRPPTPSRRHVRACRSTTPRTLCSCGTSGFARAGEGWGGGDGV
ncbi:hypothetical protein K438DRAFT_956567 [Mycena galopus ATCC 62051]|nr:hypothetical protein K438DRAFT_956567 [Mycena galopus ATCC 62051]